MQKRETKKILAAVEDLLFVVKINEAAKRNGLQVEFVKNEKDLLAKAKEKPALIVIDLNMNGLSPIRAITKLKANPDLKGVGILGYVSHLQAELKQQAQAAGANMVLARSAFSQNMPQIFKRYAEV
jgi:CheY-like chemotaxis protein